jgi:hypothetical protein
MLTIAKELVVITHASLALDPCPQLTAPSSPAPGGGGAPGVVQGRHGDGDGVHDEPAAACARRRSSRTSRIDENLFFIN